jgi:hypothetical protein
MGSFGGMGAREPRGVLIFGFALVFGFFADTSSRMLLDLNFAILSTDFWIPLPFSMYIFIDHILPPQCVLPLQDR